MTKSELKSLFEAGKYKEVCNYVDGLFNWKPGELKREYNEESARWCLNLYLSLEGVE